LYTYGFKFGNRAYGSVTGISAQSIPNATSTNLTTYWNGTPTTSGGMTFSGGFFTVPISGIYLVIALTVFSGFATTGNERTNTILINGSPNPASLGFLSKPNPSNGRTDVIAYNIYVLNANDTVGTQVYQDSGGSLTMEANFPGYFRVSQL
jgi:hypothetical protein